MKQKIINATRNMLAKHGYNGLSMRSLAREVGVAQSVIYHYFPTKDDLLKAMFINTTAGLGVQRASLPEAADTRQMLAQRVAFQLDNAEHVVAIFKYYFHFRDIFDQGKTGFVPKTAYHHIVEVLEYGIEKGEVRTDIDIDKDAKVITHAINGFVLEYYPHQLAMKERQDLIDTITDFIYRSIKNRKGGD